MKFWSKNNFIEILVHFKKYFKNFEESFKNVGGI